MAGYLDSRELNERLEELEAIERSLDPEQDESASGEGSLGEEEREELDTLRELRDEVGDEWSYGATLIPEEEFEDYARDFAQGFGAVSDDAAWPCTCIDWKQAAQELAMDYTSVEYDGTTYLVRS